MIQTNPRNFIFEKVKMTAPERNGFDLSHENKQTCKSGFIYPFELIEALPNDDFQIQTESFIRLKPMLSPTMHRLNAYWHWFFIPNRLTWNYWEEFISRGNGKKLPQNQEYTPPEPVTISLYDLCYQKLYTTHDSFADEIRINVDTYLKATGQPLGFDYLVYLINQGKTDEATQVLQSSNPSFIFRYKKIVDGSLVSGDAKFYAFFSVFSATPRVSSSMGIVDTCSLVAHLFIDEGGTGSNVQKRVISINDYKHVFGTFANINFSRYDNINRRLQTIKLSVMPFVAFLLTYNDYYRDENLIQEYDEVLDYFKGEQGELDLTSNLVLSYVNKLMSMHFRAWEKDYFTTATQMPQKAPDVLIPGTGSGDAQIVGDLNLRFVEAGETTLPSFYNARESIAKLSRDGDNLFLYAQDENNPQSTLSLGYKSGLKIQGSNGASGTTVADVRRSFALQRWFEKAVRTGTRYIESLKAFFNSDAGDARLQRPEYIGGTSTPVQISDVVQSSATADGSDTPQGNLAGYGIASDNSEMLSYHAPEHGFIIGCFSILARTSYGQGIPNAFSRETWLDYAWPEFEHIGEQGIKNKELYAAPLTKDVLQDGQYFPEIDTANQNFGYQSRYADYKQIPDRFGGGFSRSQDFWTLGRIFETEPTLSAEFVEANVSDRNFAVSRNLEESSDYKILTDSEDVDTDQYDCDFWIDCKKVTSLTLFSEPI